MDAAAPPSPPPAELEPLDRSSIHCWSGPRCVSTSLMYAFAQRDDTQVGAELEGLPSRCARCHRGTQPCGLACRSLLAQHSSLSATQVLDEPLYAHYLRLTGAERPYTDLVSGRATGAAACSHLPLPILPVLCLAQLRPSPLRPLSACLQVMAAQNPDGNAVVHQQLLGARERPVLYAKHMAKHRLGVDRSLLRRAAHVLLVRWVGGCHAAID